MKEGSSALVPVYKLVLLEILAALSDVSGHVEKVYHGQTGRLVLNHQMRDRETPGITYYSVYLVKTDAEYLNGMHTQWRNNTPMFLSGKVLKCSWTCEICRHSVFQMVGVSKLPHERKTAGIHSELGTKSKKYWCLFPKVLICRRPPDLMPLATLTDSSKSKKGVAALHQASPWGRSSMRQSCGILKRKRKVYFKRLNLGSHSEGF